MKATFLRYLYSLLLIVALPFIFLRLALRSRKNPDYRKRWGERLGLGVKNADEKSRIKIWLHTVSVGEFIGAKPLINQLLNDPTFDVLITSTTPTGSAELKKNYADKVAHCYIPYDLPLFIRAFLNRFRPDLAIFMETELWPNILHVCHKHSVPTMLINARMSERSARGYKKFSSLTTQMMENLSCVLAQTVEHRQRFIELGCPSDRCTVVGNLKFDTIISVNTRLAAKELRDRIGKENYVWIGASTHEGEDQILLDAHKLLLARHPDSILTLVPRHPERFKDVAQLIQDNSLSFIRKTKLGNAKSGQTNVLLGDTMGELMEMYGASDIAFVGGSLVENGGHNMLEAAAWGLPIISGPSTFNFPEITRLLKEKNALKILSSADQLSQFLLEAKEKALRLQIGEEAKSVFASNQGATDRTYAEIRKLSQKKCR